LKNYPDSSIFVPELLEKFLICPVFHNKSPWVWKTLVRGTRFSQETRSPRLFLVPACARNGPKQSHSETVVALSSVAADVSPAGLIVFGFRSHAPH